MTVRHAVFRKLFEHCLRITGDTYDYAPAADAKLPFIHIQSTSELAGRIRELTGTVRAVVRFYGKREDRQTIDNWVTTLQRSLHDEKEAYGYRIQLGLFEPSDSDLRTAEPLIGTSVLIEFDYNN